MTAFDEFVNGAKKCFDVAVEKTGAAVEASKRRIEKSQLSCKLRDEYAALGRLSFETAENGADNAEKMRRCINNIRALKEQIGSLNEEQPERGNLCPVCGKPVKKGFSYCPECGAKR